MIHSNSPHSLSHSLDLLADTYNYNHWIYSLLRPFFGHDICEIGAGTGNLTQFLLNCRRLVCVEPEPYYSSALKKLSFVHRNMTVISGDIERYAERLPRSDRFDSVICTNVLEHIQEHVQALRLMGGMVKAGGAILIFVPACPWAFGTLDEALGHYRRYSRSGLYTVAREADLHIVKCQYVNFIGAFGWWWHSRMLKRREVAPECARLCDRVVPYVSAIERFLSFPIGQSLFAVMRTA